jgi:hypothetical protein
MNSPGLDTDSKLQISFSYNNDHHDHHDDNPYVSVDDIDCTLVDQEYFTFPEDFENILDAYHAIHIRPDTNKKPRRIWIRRQLSRGDSLWQLSARTHKRLRIQSKSKYALEQYHRNITLVYFVNTLVSPAYSTLMHHQLDDISKSGFLSSPRNRLVVVSLGELEESHTVVSVIRQSFPEVTSISADNRDGLFRIQHVHYDENTFEFRGIQQAWIAGMTSKNPLDIVVYIHCKGVSHVDPLKPERLPRVEKLTHEIACMWARNLDILCSIPSLDRLAFTIGGWGWGWYNFWAATAGYLQSVEMPLLTDRRHYYEDWLARSVNCLYPGSTLRPQHEIRAHVEGIGTYHQNFDCCVSVGLPEGCPFVSIGDIIDPTLSDYFFHEPGEWRNFMYGRKADTAAADTSKADTDSSAETPAAPEA